MSRAIGCLVAWLAAVGGVEARAQYSLTSGSYFQSFDALGTTTGSYAGGNLGTLGSGTTSMQGWFFGEGGSSANTTITAGNGSSNSGDTYNFGVTSGSDRALGGLLSSSVKPYWGFYFTNNTGNTITGLALSYIGQVWRTGSTGRADKISFGYSTSATTLSSTATGWTNLTALDYSYTPTAVASGSLIASSLVSGTIDTLSLANGSSIFLRWVDFDVTGADDGLAINNFSLLGLSGTSSPPPPATTGLFWDTNNATAGVGGSGTWTTSGSTFATTVDGTAVGTLASSGNVTFAGSAGTVTVSGTVSPPAGMQFSTSGYTVTGGAIALSGSAASTFTTESSVSAVVNSALSQASGSAAIVKAGDGTLELGGNNTFAGGATVSAGTLIAASNTALGGGAATVSGSGSLLAASGVTLSNAITVSGSAGGGSGGAAALLAGWDFQTTTTGGTAIAAAPSTPTVFQANFGSGGLYLDGTLGSSSWVTATSGNELSAFGGSAVNAGPGFSTVTTSPAALALVSGSTTAGGFSANGKSAVFAIDMTGKQDLAISYATQRTSTGFTTEDWSYSTDGTNWVTLQSISGTAIPTSFGAVTLSTITGLNNVANAYVRLTVSGATNGGSNIRLDNIQFNTVAGGTATGPVVATATLGSGVAGGVSEFAGPVSLGGNANLTAASLGTVTFSGTISGGGGIRKTGDGTVILSADESYTGGTTVEAGQLRLGAGGATGSVVGGVQLLAPTASLSLDRSDDFTFANAVSGSGGLFKEEGNTVTLTGSSSYTGGTTLFAGTLVVGNGGTQGSIAATGPIDLSVGTQLVFDRTDDVVLSGSVTGDGTIVQTGLGTLTLSQAGQLGNAALRLESGVVDLNRGGSSLVGILGAGNTVQLAGGTLELTSDAGEETKLTGAAITVESDSTLAVNKIGAAGNHTTTGFDAPITIGNSATLTFDYRGAFSSNTVPVVQYKGMTTYTGTVTLDTSASVGVTNSSGGTAEVVFAGPVVDGGNGFDLTKVGAERLTLATANTYGGDTIINEGTLALGAVGSIANSPVVAVAAGATFDVSAKSGGYSLAAGQTLSGPGSVAGSITLGTDATVAPGAGIGALSVTQGVTWASGGDYNWQIANATGSAGAAGGWDLLNVGGTLDIQATSASPFAINLWSLSSGTGLPASGSITNFDATQNFTWKIAVATGGITGFSADKFQINTTAANGAAGFANALAGGSFSVAKNGNEIDLVFTKAGGQAGPVTITVASGSTQLQATTLSGTTPVVKDGAGTLVLDRSNTLTGPTTVSQGTLQLGNAEALASSAVTVAAGATLSVGPQVQATVPSLVNNGLVDVGLGMLTVTNGLTGDGVANAIVAVLNGGTTGITSSDAVSIPFRTVGWIDNGGGSVTFGFAAEGDTNIDGMVDLGDLQNILASGKYGGGAGAVWSEGDFNYDGVVDLSDLQDILASGLYGQGSYMATPLARFAMLANGGLGSGGLGDPMSDPSLSLGAVTAVPEPSTSCLAAVAAGMVALLNRGLRRTRNVRNRGVRS
ncbi:MAG: autotransporter-associated beta strand repeat-containing protein [Planctomycetia bacterium]